MLRQLERALLVLIAASMSTTAAHARAVSGTCASKDAASDRLISFWKTFVGKHGLGDQILQKELGLTGVTPAQVSLISDRAVCSKAAVAYDAHLDNFKNNPKYPGMVSVQKRSSYSLYVVTLGSSYAVEDTKPLQPGYETADVYDKDWKFIGERQVQSSKQ